MTNPVKHVGLIEWKTPARGTPDGMGRITARGIDVVEGNAPPPIAISIDNRSYSVSTSMGVQIGDRNVQGDICLNARVIFDAVDQSTATANEKEEAKAIWQKVIENPTLWRIIRGILG